MSEYTTYPEIGWVADSDTFYAGHLKSGHLKSGRHIGAGTFRYTEAHSETQRHTHGSRHSGRRGRRMRMHTPTRTHRHTQTRTHTHRHTHAHTGTCRDTEAHTVPGTPAAGEGKGECRHTLASTGSPGHPITQRCYTGFTRIDMDINLTICNVTLDAGKHMVPGPWLRIKPEHTCMTQR